MQTIITAQIKKTIESKNKLTQKELIKELQELQDAPIGQHLKNKSIHIIEKSIEQRRVKSK